LNGIGLNPQSPRGSVGIAFDIPADTVKSVITQLKEHGTVTRGWIGVQIQPVTQDIALSVKGDKVQCAINGTVVGTYNKSAVVGAGKLSS